MKTYYKLIPWGHRPRLLDTEQEALTAAHALRKQNCGYFLYEVTEQDNKRQTRFMTGWRP